MVSLYYALPKEKESDCQKFNVSVKLIEGNDLLLSQTLAVTGKIFELFFASFLPAESMQDNKQTYKLTIKVL